MLRLFISILSVLLITGNASAIVDITDCTVISSEGEYRLNQNILIPPPIDPNSSIEIQCIKIISSDVILDGAGLTIEGPNRYTGVYADGSFSNITVKNLTATNLGIGIYYSEISNGIITDNTVSSNQYGIYLYDSSNNNLINNNASSNRFIGIDLHNSTNNHLTNNKIVNNYIGILLGVSSNNLIYNNYFNNTETNAWDDGNNIWNIIKTSGINIIGGPYLGGNYWSNYTGNDTDGDGLGNELIPHNSSGYIKNEGDYLPLTKEKVTQIIGSEGGTVTTDPAGIGPTASDSLETSITIPSGTQEATVSIEEVPTTDYPTEGYQLVGQQISITAPEATAESPLVIYFSVNSTQIPLGQQDLDNIVVFRNGGEIENKNISADPAIADPDPCISERVVLPNGDGRITILTSSASTWGLFIPTPYKFTLNLIDKVEFLNLQQGIDNSLDVKLEAAVNALIDINVNNDIAAINSFGAFINAIEAQKGKQISYDDAEALIADAEYIIARLNIQGK